MPSPASPCGMLTGALRDKCEKTQQDTQNGTGLLGSLVGSPGSDWWRHAVIRVVEVVVGTAMIIAGIKALTRGSDTANIIVQASKKVGKKI